MFKGMATPKLDEKFRLTLPMKFRKELGYEITVVCEPGHCLGVYPRKTLETRLRKQTKGTSDRRRTQNFQRWMGSRAEDVEPDVQGRITLTQQQRAWAEFDRDVVVIGAATHVEVWQPEAWDARLAELDEEFVDFDGLVVADS